MKVVSSTLRHSSITITADTYAGVLPKDARATAEGIARLVPRKVASIRVRRNVRRSKIIRCSGSSQAREP